MTLYYIPIEPLKERYTEQWYNFFPGFLAATSGREVVVVDGLPLVDHVSVGTFLDINSTLHYKASQLQTIAKFFHERRIKNGDIFFVADLEFWGIESIKYLADLQNIKVSLVGIMHAGSYTREDYMATCESYGQHFEKGWFQACDRVIFGSDYHREQVRKLRGEWDLAKNLVIPNPIFNSAYKGSTTPFNEKKKQIIISNRFDYEKRPNESLQFCQIIKQRHPDVEIIVTTSRPKFTSNQPWLVEYARLLEAQGVLTIYENLSKDEYHELLNESRVMLTNSIEENFGYCVAEALAYGVAPVAFNGLSHPELVYYKEVGFKKTLPFIKEKFKPSFLWDTPTECLAALDNYMTDQVSEEEKALLALNSVYYKDGWQLGTTVTNLYKELFNSLT